ncbi:MAG: Imm50 family immunity protein [Pyrinomonadaceae bacterium]
MEKIENIHLLWDVFGYFPSFHDAEVLQVVLNRGSTKVLPTLEAQIHVFEMTSEVKDGSYVLTHHTLVTFQFLEIDGLTLSGFNHHNVLAGLFIKDISDHQLEWLKYEVKFDGIHGLDCRFRCRSIKIVGVEPNANGFSTTVVPQS